MLALWTNGTIVTRCTITILSGAALLFVGCDQAAGPAPRGSRPAGGPQADLSAQTVSQIAQHLAQQLLASDPLVPDGTLAPDDQLPFGHTIHVVDRDNKDGWKVQVSSGAV